VTNTGSAAAAISAVTDGSGFAETGTCGSTLAAGATCTASVTFTPTAAGAASASLTVSSNATNAALTVALSGTGTSAPTNLALNQPITASSATSGFPATNANDGSTRAAARAPRAATCRTCGLMPTERRSAGGGLPPGRPGSRWLVDRVNGYLETSFLPGRRVEAVAGLDRVQAFCGGQIVADHERS